MHTAKSTGISQKKGPNYTEHHETEGNYRTNVIGGGHTKLTAFGMPCRCYATAGTKTHGANYGLVGKLSLSVYHYILQSIWNSISTSFSCHTSSQDMCLLLLTI
jgi:hypothetical protein